MRGEHARSSWNYPAHRVAEPRWRVHAARMSTQDLARPEASALAVKRGRIYAVGNDAEILGSEQRPEWIRRPH